MKVKVSYTMNLEEVPSLITNIISDCHDKISIQLSRLKNSTHNLEKMVNDINYVRETLSLVDSKLEDCTHIAAGYYSAINSEAQVEESSEASISERPEEVNDES